MNRFSKSRSRPTVYLRSKRTSIAIAALTIFAALLAVAWYVIQPAAGVGFQVGDLIFDKPIVNVWSGRCVGVTDGDTVKVLNADNVEFKIRLEGIDAPESKQAFGDKSKRHLSELVFGRDVQVLETGQDFFRRTLAVIVVDGTNVNESMIRDGFAWWYRKYNKHQRLGEIETEGRNAKLGLWSDSEPISPWDWRKR